MASLALPGQGRQEESEAAVYLTVLVAIVLGLIVQGSIVGRTQTASAGGSTIAYPASWQRVAEDGALVAAVDMNHGGIFGPRVSVREAPANDLLARTGSPVDAATAWSLTRSNDLVGFRILGIT